MKTYKLRDGTKVLDPRLGRLVRFDPRSRAWPIRAVVPKTPRSYSWRCFPRLDQGTEGACVGFGVSHELAARPSEAAGITNTSARKLYWEAQKLDDWPGGAYPGAKPFYEGSSVLAGMKAAQAAGWFDSYRWAFGIEDLVLGLGYNGPAVLGIPWYAGMSDPDPLSGLIRPTGQLQGGHCILAVAVDVPNRLIVLHNSWGRSWGLDGRAAIRWEDLAKLLRRDGEAAFAVGRHTQPRKARP